MHSPRWTERAYQPSPTEKGRHVSREAFQSARNEGSLRDRGPGDALAVLDLGGFDRLSVWLDAQRHLRDGQADEGEVAVRETSLGDGVAQVVAAEEEELPFPHVEEESGASRGGAGAEGVDVKDVHFTDAEVLAQRGSALGAAEPREISHEERDPEPDRPREPVDVEA